MSKALGLTFISYPEEMKKSVSSHLHHNTRHPWPPAFLHVSPAGQLHPRNLTPLLLSLMHYSHSLKLDMLLSGLEAGKKMNLIWAFPPQGATRDMSPESNYFTCMYVSKDLHASGTSVPYTLGFSVLFQVQVNPHEKDNKSTLHILL